MKFINFILLIFLFFFSACASLNNDLNSNYNYSKVISPDLKLAESLYLEAKTVEKQANDKESLVELVNIYEKVLENNPNHLDSLSELGHFYLLLGDGFETNKSKQSKFFLKAIEANHRFMYLNNPRFRERIDSGGKLWEALDLLTENEMQAMHFWTTGVFYYYKSSLGFWGQIFNYKSLIRAKSVMQRMTDINPDWGNGMLDFNWACYYLSIPESLGGDREKSKDFFDKAVDKSKDKMAFTWGRAKYYYTKMNNPQGFKKDLEWLMNQNIDNFTDPTPWKNYFKGDAQLMLNNYEKHFDV